jgi:hypothetical protein
MNLHGIVSPYVGVVNPSIAATLRVSTGYTTQDDGTRVPTYSDTPNVPAQVQAMSFGDIQMLDGLQLQGEKRKIYLNGRFDSLSRERGTGGDLVIFPSGSKWPFGTTWKIAMVLEQYPDWCSVAVTLQNNS